MEKDKGEQGSFGEIASQLDELLRSLEGDELSLEHAVEAYERGTKLIHLAQQRLGAAEQKVRVLSEQDGAELSSTGSDNAE